MAAIDKTAGARRRRLVICLDEVKETILAIGRNDGHASARQLLTELRLLRESHRNSLEADHYLTRDGNHRLTWKYPGLARLWTRSRSIPSSAHRRR